MYIIYRMFFFCFFGSRGKKITSRERHKRDNRERAWSQAKNVLSSKPWWRPVTPAIQYLAGAAHWLVKPVNSRPMPEPLQWDTDDCYNHWTRFQIGCIVLFSGLREEKRYSWTPLFRSPKGNRKKFEIAGFRNNRGSVKLVTMNHFLIKYSTVWRKTLIK